jgi:hypothetical protein
MDMTEAVLQKGEGECLVDKGGKAEKSNVHERRRRNPKSNVAGEDRSRNGGETGSHGEVKLGSGHEVNKGLDHALKEKSKRDLSFKDEPMEAAEGRLTADSP